MAEPLEKDVFEGIELGVGTWSWGDRLMWGYGRGYTLGDLHAAFETCLTSKIHMFDTAEVYGQGQSEQITGSFLKATTESVFIATKFMPFPWRLSRSALRKALTASLRRLGLPAVDLYQIHMPLPPVTIETWMEAMTEVYQAGLISSVGVSNYDNDQMQRAYDHLLREGIRLASNQVEYSLLNRKIEKDGMLRRCTELGVKVLAYSPLAMGILSGKYSPEKPPQGIRGGRFNRRFLEKIQPLLKLMTHIGSDHSGKNPAQVALNWAICKGTLPIPGAKTARQAEQNAGALGWRLTEAEVANLDEVSDRVLAD
jgi:aryl-alcohol dehydrogenase-like predicted oxidoreductase